METKQNNVQKIDFTTNKINSSDYLLLELPENLIDRLHENETLVFRGAKPDSAVLCTENETYSVTLAETSNSLVLIKGLAKKSPPSPSTSSPPPAPPNLQPAIVENIFGEYLEVSRCQPRIKKGLDLLKETRPFDGGRRIDMDGALHWTELCAVLQASDEEVARLFGDLKTLLKIEGRVRLLDDRYQFTALTHMLNLIDENCWSLDGVDLDETINSLEGIVPEVVINAIFDNFAVESRRLDGVQFYAYKTDKIVRVFAFNLLKELKKCNFDDFLRLWSEALPEGISADIDALNGIGIVSGKVVTFFPEEELSEEIPERFGQIFEAKEKWSFSEIQPYLIKRAMSKEDLFAMLSKHARSFIIGDTTYYSAKHLR